MRHAVVVAPAGFELPVEGSVFAAAEPVGPFCAAMARGGSRVMLVRTTADLATDFAQAVADVGAGDDLIVHVAAATTMLADGLALLLGVPPAATLALSALSDVVLARGPSGVLFVIEAAHDGDPADPMVSVEHVDAIIRSLDARSRGHGVLVGARPQSRATAHPWPFTHHVIAALHDPAARDESGAVRLPLVYEQLRSSGTLAADVQGFALVRGHGDFALAERSVNSDVAPRPPAEPVEGDAAPPQPSAPQSPSEPDAERPSGGAPADEIAAEPPPTAVTDGATMDGDAAPPSSPRLPEPRATEPSLPAIEPLLDLADSARERGALVEALAGYKATLMLADPGDTTTRATVYARIGEIKRAQNRPREAELNFEKALAVDPTHAAALDALVALATEAHEVRRAIDWRRKRLQTETEPDARVDELLAIAAAHGEQLQDTAAAIAALDEALAVAPKSRASLEKLRAVLEKHGRWAQLVDVLAELAATAVEPKERGALSFAGADVALGRLRDEDRGLPLLERALEDDPAHDAALQALVAVRTSRGEWQALDATYARLVDRFAVLGDVERAWDTCRKLAVVRRDKLRDAHGAVEGFAGAVRCKPDDVDSRAMLADAYLAVGDEPRAVAEFERIAQLAPTRASTHARLFALHRRAGRTDRAWLAGAALEELGAADMDQQLVVDQYRLDGPIRPSRSLDGAAWSELLRAPGSDDVVADVLRSIAPAAISRRVDELRQSRQLAVLDPARRQSAASTVTAVRSFQWAAQVLGVEAPDLYVMDAVPGGIAAVRSPTPATALGPDVLRGLTTKDLAFLAARHLTYYRPEHVALIYYPTVADLSVLFLGALLVAMPDLPVPPQSRDAATRTRKALARQVGDDDRRTLVAAVERLEARGGRADLAAWIRGVELAAQRAGLLLCGDLAVAVARLRADGDTRPIGELTFDDKRGDLLAFSASEQLARAREALSVDLPSSGAGAQAAAAGQLQAS